MPRFAAIDVGSNAMRLRIVEAAAPRPLDSPQDAKETWREIASLRAAVRLGGEVFTVGRLTPHSIGEACKALRDFRTEMDSAKVHAYRAAATSAVREAENGSTLVERARRETGVELDVIEGVEEARIIQLAVSRRLPLNDKRVLLVDVGGGSTEMTYLDCGELAFSISLPLGTVRLLDTYLKGAKTIDRERETLLREAVDRSLAEALPSLAGVDFDALIGTGGNVETLCDLCPMRGGHSGFPKAIDVMAMRLLFDRLGALTANERRDTFALRQDRADTIVPASAIFLHLARVFRQPAVVVPSVGLTSGILEELIDKYFNVWDSAGQEETILAGCTRLGRRFHFDERHGQLVARFAAQLFDDLQSVHAFSGRDRLLLRAAAILHDIGDFVRYDGHHKHSYYLIQQSDIMGLTRDERSIVANIARYHRKGPPDPDRHQNFRDLDKEARGKVRGLSAILRIADALDREHLAKIEGVRAAVDRSSNTLLLFLRGAEERELEEWTVKAKSQLLRDEFDLDVVIAKGEVRP
jgi:exopolyphosphatase/guanosine-5'-triphosphate,3'-diphosphate pyrophosphatase